MLTVKHCDSVATALSERSHQVLHHAHPLAPELGDQAVDVHEVVVAHVLDQVIQRHEHARPAHARTARRGQENARQ